MLKSFSLPFFFQSQDRRQPYQKKELGLKSQMSKNSRAFDWHYSSTTTGIILRRLYKLSGFRLFHLCTPILSVLMLEWKKEMSFYWIIFKTLEFTQDWAFLTETSERALKDSSFLVCNWFDYANPIFDSQRLRKRTHYKAPRQSPESKEITQFPVFHHESRTEVLFRVVLLLTLSALRLSSFASANCARHFQGLLAIADYNLFNWKIVKLSVQIIILCFA